MIAKITEFQNIVDSMSSIEFEEMVCVVYGEKYKRYRNFHISHLGKEYGKLKPIKHPVDVEITYIDECDSLCHVFIAASNQQTNLYSEGGKLKKDCDSILNYIKDNNVSNAEIIAVYSKNPTERNNLFIELLKSELKNQGVSLSLVNAETLNIYINEYCPYVYRDYLHLNLYSGGISTLDNHLDNKLGEYYKYELLSRESELKELKEILSTKRCLLIRGHSGCGKTRLAIELAKTTFESNFKCLWIEPLNISSINDFDNFYEKDSKIVVIIDDLNKIPFLNNVLQKILSYENTYVIMTLRDYLYDEYRQIVDVKYYEYSLKELEPNKIKEILKCIFNVSDKFLDFVLLITRNNLRFAIMATKVIAVDKKTPNSVDEIFDAYYKELVKKIEINDNEQLKRTIVALSFFDSIDLRSKENNRLICSSFGIEETEFLEMCNMAHEKEIADFYFDKMFIKISDQIFAEYLFYKYVFVFNKIDIFDLFKTYYKNRKHRFVQIIKAIVNVYYSDDSFNRQLNDFKNKVINSNDQDLIIVFFSIFAQLFPQESIDYSFNELNSCEEDIGEDYLSISNTYNYLDLINVLLSNYNSKHYSQVANCILLLVQKDNLRSYLIKKIVSNCSIKSESYDNILRFYNLLIKEACELASNDSKYLEFLFDLVKKIYPYETDYNEFYDEKSLTFYQFTLPFNDLYKETRDNMWDAIYLLHKCSYDDKKLNELVKYNFSNADVTKHRKYDSEQALRVFDKLDLSEPRDIVFAFSLLNQFSKFEKVKTAIETMPKDSEVNLYYDFVVTKLSSLYGDELSRSGRPHLC